MSHTHSPRIIGARNVNQALYEGLWWLACAGRVEKSRNGPVLVAPGPVITHYTHPRERVLFSEVRDANPFFHLYEAVWMLAGRNDSAAVARYAKTMDSFAENGILNGAYGHRWRRHFGWDQLIAASEELKANPQSRRVVIEMWDPGHHDVIHNYVDRGDFYKATHGSKDVPCNTHVYFGIDANGLNMTVCNRSNDMIWGGYGANYVHMGLLQEVLAASIGVPVGSYYQMSNNFHVYPERADTQRLIRPDDRAGYEVAFSPDDRYDVPAALTQDRVTPFPIEVHGLKRFLDECEGYATEPIRHSSTTTRSHEWFPGVFAPMMQAHALYKEGDYQYAYATLKLCTATDWATAGTEWLRRREVAQQRKLAGADHA